MNYKTKYLTIIIVFLFAIQINILADCVKTAKGYVKFSLSYHPKGFRDHIKQTRTIIGLLALKRDGRYGGRCSTFVGRQKARRRACNKAFDALKVRFMNKPEVQKAYIRESLKQPGIFQHYQDLKNADWIKIESFKLTAKPTDQRNRSRKTPGFIIREFKINATNQKFKCL